MALRPKVLYRGQPGTTDTLLYTAPSTNTFYTIVKTILIHNTTSVAVNIKLYTAPSGGTAADSNKFFDADIAANGTVMIDGSILLDFQETLRAIAGSANAITLNISGVEYTQ